MNNLQIIGNVVSDAEVKDFSGKPCIVFKVAVNEKNSKGEQESTFFNCYKTGDKTAVSQYIKKGDKIFVSGRLSVKNSEKDGKTFTNININVNIIELLGQKRESEQVNTSPQTTQTDGRYNDLPF